MTENDTLRKLKDAIVNIDIEGSKKLAEKALENGILAEEIVKTGLSKGLNEVGLRYEKGEYFLSELMMSAIAARAVLDVIKPKLESSQTVLGSLAIGTVKGDMHDIGKNLTKMLAEASGFKVHDLGTDVSPQIFVDKINELKPDILGLSGLLTACAQSIKETIGLVRKNVGSDIKILVGGGAVNKKVAIEYGADDYTDDAVKGLEIMKSWVKKVE